VPAGIGDTPARKESPRVANRDLRQARLGFLTSFGPGETGTALDGFAACRPEQEKIRERRGVVTSTKSKKGVPDVMARRMLRTGAAALLAAALTSA